MLKPSRFRSSPSSSAVLPAITPRSEDLPLPLRPMSPMRSPLSIEKAARSRSGSSPWASSPSRRVKSGTVWTILFHGEERPRRPHRAGEKGPAGARALLPRAGAEDTSLDLRPLRARVRARAPARAHRAPQGRQPRQQPARRQQLGAPVHLLPRERARPDRGCEIRKIGEIGVRPRFHPPGVRGAGRAAEEAQVRGRNKEMDTAGVMGFTGLMRAASVRSFTQYVAMVVALNTKHLSRLRRTLRRTALADRAAGRDRAAEE